MAPFLHDIIWTIWLEHNWRVYENSSGDVSVVWDSVLYFLASCSKVDHSFSFYLNHFIVMFDWFSFLMRTIFNFINIFLFSRLKKEKKKKINIYNYLFYEQVPIFVYIINMMGVGNLAFDLMKGRCPYRQKQESLSSVIS